MSDSGTVYCFTEVAKVVQFIPQIRICVRNIKDGRINAKLYADGWPEFSTLVCQILYPSFSEVANFVTFWFAYFAYMYIVCSIAGGYYCTLFHIQRETGTGSEGGRAHIVGKGTNTVFMYASGIISNNA